MDPAIIVAIVTGIPGLIAAWMVYQQSGRANDSKEKEADLAWSRELRQDALDTRREMEILQEQVRSLRRQLETVTREAEHWISEYQFANRTIHRPGITVARLREMFPPLPQEGPGPPPSSNGSGSRLVH